jgi:hypothetical protein
LTTLSSGGNNRIWVAGEMASGDGHPKRIGLLAKNGGNKEAPEVDAAFEYFERKAPAAPRK